MDILCGILCEIWHLSPSDKHKLDVAWNNCFRKFFNACWRESAKPLLFYCNTMTVSHHRSKKDDFFYKKLLCHNNVVLYTMSKLAANEHRDFRHCIV